MVSLYSKVGCVNIHPYSLLAGQNKKNQLNIFVTHSGESLHSQYRKTHAALELSDSLVQAKNVHGSLFFFSFHSFALHRPRIITFFFCMCSSSWSVFNKFKRNQSNDYIWRFCCKHWIHLVAVLCCAFFVLHNFFYFYSHFYGYALFILIVVV